MRPSTPLREARRSRPSDRLMTRPHSASSSILTSKPSNEYKWVAMASVLPFCEAVDEIQVVVPFMGVE